MMWHPDICKPLTSLIEADEITIELLQDSINTMRQNGRSCDEIAELLKNKIKIKSFADDPKDALLMQAMLKGYTNVVKVLCKFSIDNAQDQDTALKYAHLSLRKPAKSKENMIKAIKKQVYSDSELADDLEYCEPTMYNKMAELVLATGNTRLHKAASQGNYIQLKEYLDQGDHVNAQNMAGDTTSHMVVFRGDTLQNTSKNPEEAKEQFKQKVELVRKENEDNPGTILMVSNGPAIAKPLGKNQEEITMYKQAQSVELLAERGADFTLKNIQGYTPFSLMRDYHFDKVLSGTSKRMEKADTPQKMTSIYKEIVWQWETAIKNDLCPQFNDDVDKKAFVHKTSRVASMIENLKMQYQEKLAEKITVKDLEPLATLELVEQAEKQKDELASSDVHKDCLVSSELVSNEQYPSTGECDSSNNSHYEIPEIVSSNFTNHFEESDVLLIESGDIFG